MYPADGAVRLVFRDAAGREVASLIKPANPVVPMQGNAARPARGGIRLAGGAMTAYLVEGRVAFRSKFNDLSAVFPPYPAGSGPAPAAVYAYDKIANVGALPGLKNRVEFGYFGYAQANVTRVVLRLQGPTGHAAIDVPTIAAGWPGTSVRLWSVQQP
jgi:hypothetical protein